MEKIVPEPRRTPVPPRSPQEMSSGERLVRAILERRAVRLIYQGLPREIEPHMVGIHEAGEPILVAYQTGGYSHSGELPGWRTFITTEIERVEESDAPFPRARSDFTDQFYSMMEIFAKV
ncbi:hypothetical protein BH24GEM1_BH24GEM1_23880 [soil metagenome]